MICLADLKTIFMMYAHYAKSKKQIASISEVSMDGSFACGLSIDTVMCMCVICLTCASLYVKIDCKRFNKLCKESKLLNKKFNANACDLLFTSLARPKKTISFPEFEAKALPELAGKLGISVDEIKAKITSGGPQSSGTKAQYNKFHDDKATWTATAVAGGPTTIDNAITLSNLADRSSADVRGVKY